MCDAVQCGPNTICHTCDAVGAVRRQSDPQAVQRGATNPAVTVEVNHHSQRYNCQTTEYDAQRRKGWNLASTQRHTEQKSRLLFKAAAVRGSQCKTVDICIITEDGTKHYVQD